MCFFFFFNDTATTEIYTLPLHDALPIPVLSPATRVKLATLAKGQLMVRHPHFTQPIFVRFPRPAAMRGRDRKSTRLNSSHANISYAVFCLKKKKNKN